MPPKKGGGASKKAVEKQKDKAIEDKTFGLKNKNKSKNVQKYIQEVTKQVKGGTTRADRLKEQQKKQKKDAKAEEEALKSLFAAAITQPKVQSSLAHSHGCWLLCSAPLTLWCCVETDRSRPESTPSRCSAPSSRMASAPRLVLCERQ